MLWRTAILSVTLELRSQCASMVSVRPYSKGCRSRCLPCPYLFNSSFPNGVLDAGRELDQRKSARCWSASVYYPSSACSPNASLRLGAASGAGDRRGGMATMQINDHVSDGHYSSFYLNRSFFSTSASLGFHGLVVSGLDGRRH